MALILYRTIDPIPESVRHLAARTPDGWWQIEEDVVRRASVASRPVQPREPGCIYLSRREARDPTTYNRAVREAGSFDKIRYLSDGEESR